LKALGGGITPNQGLNPLCIGAGWETGYPLGVKSGKGVVRTWGHGIPPAPMDADLLRCGYRIVLDTLVVHTVTTGHWA
jgi:hypothetical protein